MGKGSSGPGQVTTTSSSQPPKYLDPYIQQYLQLQNYLTTGNQPTAAQEQKYWGGQAPSTVPYAGPPLQVSPFTGSETLGLSSLGTAAGEQAMFGGQAAATANNILAGNNLSPATNPQLQAYYNAAAQPLTANYTASTAPSAMSAAALSGAFGGSADAENRALGNYNFGNQLQNLAANIYEPAYQQGQQQITQTEALAPSLTSNLTAPGETQLAAGGVEQQQNQAVQNANYQNQYAQSMWPYEAASLLGGSLQPAGMGYGTQASTQYGTGGSGGGVGSSILGYGLGGLGALSLLGGSGGASAGLSSLGSLAQYIPFFGGGIL